MIFLFTQGQTLPALRLGPHPKHCKRRTGETCTGKASRKVETKERTSTVKGREEKPEILREKKKTEKESLEPA